MLQPVIFKVQLFMDRSEAERIRSQKALLWLLEGLCQVNESHFAARWYPPLYQSGIRYEVEEGEEIWMDVPTLIDAGYGDCEDLACYRIAELRNGGHRASPYVTFRQIDGAFRYHALVHRYDNGRHWIEDPSKRLGMGMAA